MTKTKIEISQNDSFDNDKKSTIAERIPHQRLAYNMQTISQLVDPPNSLLSVPLHESRINTYIYI